MTYVYDSRDIFYLNAGAENGIIDGSSTIEFVLFIPYLC